MPSEAGREAGTTRWPTGGHLPLECSACPLPGSPVTWDRALRGPAGSAEWRGLDQRLENAQRQ